jgi:archaellin
LDYIDYVPSSKILTITRNPYGFENKISPTSGYKGVNNEKKKIISKTLGEEDIVVYEDKGTISDEDFIKKIVKILKKSDITAIPRGTAFAVHTALPDTLKEFVNVFVNKSNGNIANADKLKRRIIGLTSYFRSAQEELLPTYDKDFNRRAVIIPMSDYQFKVYEDYRFYERRSETTASNKKRQPGGQTIDIDGIFKEPSSSYRIFSRLACNFVMPNPPGRPNPMEYGMAINVKAVKEIHGWLEAEYNKREAVVPQDTQKKYNKFVFSIPKQNFAKYIDTIRDVLSAYIEETITNAYEGSIEEIAKKLGHDVLFSIEEGSNKTHSNVKEKVIEKKKEEKVRVRGRPKKADKGGAISDSEEDDKDGSLEGGGSSSDEEGEIGEEINPIEEFVENTEEEAIALDGYQDEDANLREIEELEGDELLEKMGNAEYKEAVKAAYKFLQLHSRSLLNPKALETYSPKYLTMLENIEDPDHQGLHLVYSQFRSMEGLGIFSLTLEANGFARFKIKRNGLNEWVINMSEEDMGKPCYALYTGTEGAEEREIIRNIYNGTWDYIPNNIAAQLKAKSTNNNMGEIIKILMITSAGSEGINLRNTRYVHIMEPYWHPVRTEQVIGRARRICSHQSLPKALQTVDVFIYIMTFTKSQIDSDYAIELRVKDASKLDRNVYQTSDEKLYEISNIKERLTNQLLTNIKEAAIDCATHIKSSTKEGLSCLSFGSSSPNEFSYNPNYSQDENDAVASINQTQIKWDAREFTDKKSGKKYMLRTDTRQVYDYNSVLQAQQNPKVRPILIGRLVKNAIGAYEIVKE